MTATYGDSNLSPMEIIRRREVGEVDELDSSRVSAIEQVRDLESTQSPIILRATLSALERLKSKGYPDGIIRTVALADGEEDRALWGLPGNIPLLGGTMYLLVDEKGCIYFKSVSIRNGRDVKGGFTPFNLTSWCEAELKRQPNTIGNHQQVVRSTAILIETIIRKIEAFHTSTD